MKNDGSGGKLLLVDDDMLLRGMAAQTLRHAGFAIEEAESGEDALALFGRTPFDLVLLDVMMPGLDGYQVCERMRAHPGAALLPILMLTGLNDTESIELAYRSGATDFIAKPINWTLLVHRVRYALRASAAAENLARGRDSLERAQRLAGMGSWEWVSASGRMTCSAEYLRFCGLAFAVFDNTTPDAVLAGVHPDDHEKVRAARVAALAQGQGYQLTFDARRFDGERRTVFEQTNVVKDAQGRIARVDGIMQDITQRLATERRIHELAFHDALTGLPNRRLFDQIVQAALERARRLGSMCAVLHVDLDRFKGVNDAYGNDAGDALLRLVAERLEACTRSSDFACVNRLPLESEMVARVGGNAFTILLCDVAGADAAGVAAQRLLDAIARPMTLGARELVLTASAGISLFPRDAGDLAGLTRFAEQALYAAKDAGRARHRFFDEAMNKVASSRLELESDLRRAIDTGELRLYLQPKVDAASGTVTAAEALVRWQHPQRGMVAPGEFIPLAEKTGLIVPLGDWVLETACGYLRDWGAAGLASVPLSINLSAPSFLKADLVAQLDDALRRHGLAACQLTIEVTESMLMGDLKLTIARLGELRERGFGLSMDDFGTGYSSLSYLKQFPIDELKIDRSFVHDVTNGRRDAALVASIIGLGRQFGLRVVAEGVETPEQARLLLALGCPDQQGYLFARPMPVAQFEALLAAGGKVAGIDDRQSAPIDVPGVLPAAPPLALAGVLSLADRETALAG